MKEFLKKLKLIQYLTFEIDIQRSDFVKKLRNIVDEEEISILSDPFEAFSRSKNEYKGQVGDHKFKIKRRKKFFDMNMNFAVAEGTYQQQDENLLFEIEINGFIKMMIAFYVIVTLFYILFIGAFFTVDVDEDFSVIMLPFIILHGAMMFGMPYYLMRRSASKMRHEIEREFFFIAKRRESLLGFSNSMN